jgi:hypothetical protein
MGYGQKNKKIRIPWRLASKLVAGTPKNCFLLAPGERRSWLAKFLIAGHLSAYFCFMQDNVRDFDRGRWSPSRLD